RTGTVVVLVEPGGERTMLPDRAAAVEFTIDDAGADEVLTGADWLHVTAYSFVLEPVATSARRLVYAARRAALGVSVDSSSNGLTQPFGIERFTRLLAELGPDVLFANATEAALLEEQPTPGTYVIKRGADPAEVRRPGQPPLVVPAVALTEVI